MWPTLWKSGKEDLFPIIQFRDSLHHLFDDFFDDPTLARRGNGNGRRYLPPVDLKETDGSLIVETDLPGLEAKDVTVEFLGDLLSIRGERTEEKEEKSKSCYRQERFLGAFERQIRLPLEVDRDKAEAVFKNGVLRVTLPKKSGTRPKSVAIKVK